MGKLAARNGLRQWQDLPATHTRMAVQRRIGRPTRDDGVATARIGHNAIDWRRVSIDSASVASPRGATRRDQTRLTEENLAANGTSR
jgi:hypothetical protein